MPCECIISQGLHICWLMVAVQQSSHWQALIGFRLLHKAGLLILSILSLSWQNSYGEVKVAVQPRTARYYSAHEGQLSTKVYGWSRNTMYYHIISPLSCLSLLLSGHEQSVVSRRDSNTTNPVMITSLMRDTMHTGVHVEHYFGQCLALRVS